MKTLFITLVAAVATAFFGCGDDSQNGSAETICDDLVDNDDDGRTDCQDPDCAEDPGCTGPRCGDGSCDAGENSADCPEDCDSCDTGSSCGACAMSPCSSEDTCAAEIERCMDNNPECVALDICIDECADDEPCEAQCIADHPDGVEDLTALYTCVMCIACPLDCALEGADLCR